LKSVLAAANDPEYSRAQHSRREATARDFEQRVALVHLPAGGLAVQEDGRVPQRENLARPAHRRIAIASALGFFLRGEILLLFFPLQPVGLRLAMAARARWRA